MKVRTGIPAPAATQNSKPNPLDLPKNGRWRNVLNHAKESLVIPRFEPHDPSDLAPISRTRGGGNRANKRLKNPVPLPLSDSEHGRDMSPRAATLAAAQRQSRSTASSIGVVGTAKSSTTFDSESKRKRLQNGPTKDHCTFDDDLSMSVRQVVKKEFRSHAKQPVNRIA
jgi:hypothetical protein